MSTMLSSVLPKIVTIFNISLDSRQWLISSYYLCMAIMTPLSAFFIQRIPTKILFVCVEGIFTFGLLLCTTASNFPLLLIGRILQACATGVLFSGGQVVLMTIYPENKWGEVMGGLGLAQSSLPIIAPTISGVLIDCFGWRAVFTVPLCISALSLVWTCVSFKNVLPTHRVTIDLPFFFLSVVFWGGINIALGGKRVIWSLFLFGCGLTAGTLFVRCQLFIRNPLLQLRILKYRDNIHVA